MIPENKAIRYFIGLLGLIACTLAGLNWNVGMAAWFAPLLLLYYSKQSKWSGVLFLFLGLSFCSAISKTAENLSGVFFIYITTGLSYGFVHSLPFVLEKLLVKKGLRFYSTLIFPSAVVATEYALSLGIGIWGNGAIAQYPNSNLIQITSVFGVFGVSFLVAWLASTINWLVENGLKSRRSWIGLVVYGSCFFTVWLFGILRKNASPVSEETVKVATIVGETDIHQVFEDWKEEIIGLSKNQNQNIPEQVYSDSLALNSLIVTTEEALTHGAEIIVWNEISLLLKASQVNMLVQRIRELCLRYQAFVLIAVLEKNAGELPKPFHNKSILINPEGGISWEYVKHVLNPLEGLVINKGSGPLPFLDTKYGRIANVICADLDFSAYISQIGKESVDILLVPAYDWEAITPYHAHMAAFAAIQYGVHMVRANGKGITAFYDTRGNIRTQSNTFTSAAKITFAEVPLTRVTTVYSLIGDRFVHVLLLFLLILTGLRLLKRVDI